MANDEEVKNEMKVLIAEVLKEEFIRDRLELKESIPFELITVQLSERFTQEIEFRRSVELKAGINYTNIPLFNDEKVRNIIQKEFSDCPLEVWSAIENIPPCYIIKKGQKRIILEVKQKLDVQDIPQILKTGKLYRSLNSCPVLGCAVIVDEITPAAETAAKKCQIRVIYKKN